VRLNIRPRFWVIIIAIMLIAFSVSFAMAQHNLAEGRAVLEAALQERRMRKEQVADLQEELDYVLSDDYIIRVARNELDMLMQDEIRYVSD